MPHSPKVAPIDKSIPEVMMTKVIPSARKALMEICLSMIRILSVARKPDTVKVKNPSIRNKAMKVRNFSSINNRFSRDRKERLPVRGANVSVLIIFMLEPFCTRRDQCRFLGRLTFDVGGQFPIRHHQNTVGDRHDFF